MKHFFILSLFLFSNTICSLKAQNSLHEKLSSTTIKENCYNYLSAGDTDRFEQALLTIFPAYEAEMDSLNVAIRNELLMIHLRDQGIRFMVIDAEATNNPAEKELRKIMKKKDSDHIKYIQYILDNYGWPSTEDIGEDASHTLFLCLQHIDDKDIQMKYLPVLKEAVAQGNATPWYYAFLIDRIKMNMGEKQIYGSQTITQAGKLSYVIPIENPDSVDIYREALHMEPMKEYLNGEWDLTDYKKNLPEYEKRYKVWSENRIKRMEEAKKD